MVKGEREFDVGEPRSLRGGVRGVLPPVSLKKIDEGRKVGTIRPKGGKANESSKNENLVR